jgi:cytochrome P450
VAVNRVVLEPLTLSDGFHLSVGTRSSMFCAEILHDPSVIPSPEVFDGFRFYKARQKPEEHNRHQFATTDASNLHFGHGKYSYPGRFFASNEIKMILAIMLLKYDMRFADGQVRPKNMTAHEYIFLDPDGVILLREREGMDEYLAFVKNRCEVA